VAQEAAFGGRSRRCAAAPAADKHNADQTDSAAYVARDGCADELRTAILHTPAITVMLTHASTPPKGSPSAAALAADEHDWTKLTTEPPLRATGGLMAPALQFCVSPHPLSYSDRAATWRS
jgi:hypothetical protein